MVRLLTSLAMISALLLAPLAPALPAANVESSADAFDKLTARWAAVKDYSVTIATQETDAGRTVHSILLYSFRKPDRARLEVLAGNNRGAVLLWDGGTAVTAYKRGFLSLVKIHTQLDDIRVTSLRGNGILTPDFGTVLACFAEHRSDVRVAAGPDVGGDSTSAIELRYDGFTCPRDSKIDDGVTRDVLLVSARTGDLVRRERYAGPDLIESYDLRDLSVNHGLDDSVFR